jgi:citrate lyase subunit beta/citryl-CoA lyase
MPQKYQNPLYILKHITFSIQQSQDYYLCYSLINSGNMSKISVAGNHGEDVRSDCLVKISFPSKGGIKLALESKVERLYGGHIHALVNDIMKFFGIKHASIQIQDSGALDFVLAARLELAIRQLTGDSREYLMPSLVKNEIPSDRKQIRFTRLYVPGNTPKLMLNAGIHKPDGIILDLEDSVSPAKKEEARLLVRNALRAIDFFQCERMVRINQLPQGLDDLDFIIPHYVNVILIPKAETPAQVNNVAERIASLNKKCKVWLMPVIESALGIENAFHIASASPDIVAVAIGLEDYTADLGVKRTKSGDETLYARLRIVNACKAAHVQPLDSVFPDISDPEGLKEAAVRSKSLGFEGVGCIHPGQIRIIRESFIPDLEETEKACRIVMAFEEAESKGLGVVSLDSKMIDRPVVIRALTTITLAEKFGILKKDWRTEYE